MDVTEKLLNVRRATRLLASYYRRVVDIVTLVDRTLESQARFRTKFLRWDAHHHRHIGQQTTSVVGRWGWDFLPVQDATFQWTTDGSKFPAGPGSVFVNIWHQSDDGYAKREDEGEPVPTDFAPVEETETRLYVFLYAVASGDSNDRWSTIERVASEAVDESDWWNQSLHRIPTDALDGADPGTQIRYMGWRIPMSALETQDAVEQQLLAPLRQALDRVVAPTQ